MENEENRELKAFVDALAALNGQLAGLYRSGDVTILSAMNKTVKEMYRLQHGKEDDAFKTIDPDCEVIYRNFDMLVAVLKTTENGEVDAGASKAVNKFLHNITDAACNIVTLFGLV